MSSLKRRGDVPQTTTAAAPALLAFLEKYKGEPFLACMVFSEPKALWRQVSKSLQQILRVVRPPFLQSVENRKSKCPAEITRGIFRLSQCFKITSLSLKSLHLTLDTAHPLFGMVLNCKELTSLVLAFDNTQSDIVKTIVSDLVQLRKLEKLTLQHCSKTTEPMHEELCAALTQIPELRNLHLDVPPMQAPELRAVLYAIAKCTKLKVLGLTGQRIAHTGEGFLEAVIDNKPLQVLNLSNNRLDKQAMRRLEPLLLNIEELDLSSNDLQEGGGVHLATKITSIKVLNLANNRIWPDGIENLFAGSTGPCALRVLCLNNNSIMTLGLRTLANSATRLVCLESLSLQNNSISPRGGEAVLQLLAQCTALSELCLAWNNLNSSIQEELLPVLPTCTTLVRLDLHGNNMAREQVTSFHASVDRFPWMKTRLMPQR